MIMKKIILLFLSAFLFLISCEKTNISSNKKLVLPEETYDYNALMEENFGFDFPNANFTHIDNNKATLGRVLFYDGALSINNKIACASCHQQDKAFTDGLNHSVGIGENKTPRNSPTITNMNFAQAFFWDFQPMTLQEQVLRPVSNHIEMGIEDMNYLVEKLSTIDYYPSLFEKAYGTDEITEEKISESLSSFVASIGSHNSKFDQVEFRKTNSYTVQEQLGRDLFLNKGCNNCHQAISNAIGHFLGYSGTTGSSSANAGTLANIGLDMEYNDSGFEDGMFKIPSMRNIALTAPYMHDGRFETLEEVIHHYNSGVMSHPNLDFRLINIFTGLPNKLNMDQQDIDHLVAFLNTFNDYDVITDRKFSDPFVE